MTELMRRTGPRWVAALGGVLLPVVLLACGGGSSGPPKTLSLSGEQVPVSEVTGAYSQLCVIAKQAQTDPAGTSIASWKAASPRKRAERISLCPYGRARGRRTAHWRPSAPQSDPAT